MSSGFIEFLNSQLSFIPKLQEKLNLLEFSFLEKPYQIMYLEIHLFKETFEKEEIRELLECIFIEATNKTNEYYFLKMCGCLHVSLASLLSLLRLLFDEIAIEEMFEVVVNEHLPPHIFDRVIKLTNTDPSTINWTRLYRYCKDDSDIEYRNIFEEKFIEYCHKAEKPSWVNTHLEDNKDIDESEELVNEKTSFFDTIQEAIHFDSHAEKEDIERVFEIYKRFYLTEKNRDRLFGLVNCREEKCCSYDGNCRMLTCECYSNANIEDDEQNNLPSWFLGRCQKCMKSINKYHYAIRMPVENGGWQGCFCSLECMEDEFSGDFDQERIMGLSVFLHTVGIMDR
jgi:hypothetical protein